MTRIEIDPPARGPLIPARLRPRDLAAIGLAGLRSRPLRVFLSALGIAIGIAAMISVVGISTSSRAELDRALAKLGTNLLTVSPGRTLAGQDAKLPKEAVGMLGRVADTQSVSATGVIKSARVYRNDRIPQGESGGIAVLASHIDLPTTIGVEISTGTWFNEATARHPAVVLGTRTAELLGVTAGLDVQVWLDQHWFTVIGVLQPATLTPELDRAALVGWPAAEQHLNFDGHPTTVYTRTNDNAVEAVHRLLAATVNPEHPNEVRVSRPSDALAAEHAIDTTLTGLLLGLGAVALLVGGVGVANTMVISVLERRSEIGLRRALGATRGHIRLQFLAESLLLSGFGGVAGVVLGTAVTAGYATFQRWPAVIPPAAMAGGLAATLIIGAIAGLYPAIRASRLAPTDALTAP